MVDLIYKIIGIIIAMAVVILIAGLVVFLIIRNFTKKVAKDAAIEPDAGNTNREDITSYIVFDDIRDGILILDGYTRFVTGIDIQGFDFFNAAKEEQISTEESYTRLFDVLPDSKVFEITYDQRARDLSDYISSYKDAYDQTAKKIYDHLSLIQQFEFAVSHLKKEGKGDTKEYELYTERISELQKEVVSLTSQKDELDQMVRYLKFSGADNHATDLVSTYFFDWEYEESVFSENPTNEERFQRAKKELQSLSNTYISILSAANLHARQVSTTTRMTDLFRTYFRPRTAELCRIDDIMESSVFSYAVDGTEDLTNFPIERPRDEESAEEEAARLAAVRAVYAASERERVRAMKGEE